MRDEVVRAVDELIRPLVEADGGAVTVAAVEEKKVVIHLTKACAGCPGFSYTRSIVIEPVLRKVLGPDVQIIVEHAIVKPPPKQ